MTGKIFPDTNKTGPIRVTEDSRNFLVEIHPNDRDRAKMIPGRQWDGKRTAWVYAKDPTTYDALVAEFKSDADVFDLRRPQTQRPPGFTAPPKDDHEEEYDWSALEEIGEGQSKLVDELVDVRNAVGLFRESLSGQERVLGEIQASQVKISEQIRESLVNAETHDGPELIEVLPKELDLSNRMHVELMEGTLIEIAYASSGSEQTFLDWIKKHHPLSRPSTFVTDTHELLKQQLEKIIGNVDYSTSFYDLIHQARDENLIYSDNDDPIKVFPILMTLNGIRNRFAHARGKFHQSEKWNRSLIYMMNLALVWPRIMIDQDAHD